MNFKTLSIVASIILALIAGWAKFNNKSSQISIAVVDIWMPTDYSYIGTIVNQSDQPIVLRQLIVNDRRDEPYCILIPIEDDNNDIILGSSNLGIYETLESVTMRLGDELPFTAPKRSCGRLLKLTAVTASGTVDIQIKPN